MILTYHPKNQEVKKVLLKNFSILADDPRTKDIFPTTPMCVYRRDTNLPPTSATRTELYTPKDAIHALRPVSSMPSPADDVKQCTSEKLVVSLQTGLASTSARWKGTTNTHGTRTVDSLWPNISAKGVTIPLVTCRCL